MKYKLTLLVYQKGRVSLPPTNADWSTIVLPNHQAVSLCSGDFALLYYNPIQSDIMAKKQFAVTSPSGALKPAH